MMEAFNRFEHIPWTRERGEAPLRHLVSHRELGIVGLFFGDGAVGQGEAPLGYFVVTFGYDLEWGGRDAFLTELFLGDGQWGRGLGRRTLAAVEEIARGHGARALHLMVRDDNAPAMRLYRGAGYASPQRMFLTKVLAG
jgi:GNAT superfamily N-acetyltransferase